MGQDGAGLPVAAVVSAEVSGSDTVLDQATEGHMEHIRRYMMIGRSETFSLIMQVHWSVSSRR